LIDEAFVAAYVHGWEELSPRVAECRLSWASEVTGVPAAAIEEVARLYARGPSLLWLGQGLQRQTGGGNVMRACASLPALTGNICKPGAGFLYLNGNLAQRGMDESYLSGVSLAGKPVPSISHMDLAEALEDPRRSRAFLVWNMNPLASCPQQSRLRRALARDDLLTIALDLFPTDSTAMADYVLPAASFLEFDDLVASYFQLTLSAQVKVMEPIGEALPNQEIFRRLARGMGFTEPEFLESDGDMLATLLARSGLGETFASLAAQGSRWIPCEPAVQFSERHFGTPSGRIEVASAAAAAAGLPLIPVCRCDARPEGGRLRLLTPAHAWLLNTSFGNVDKILGRLGAAEIVLHPLDAAARGLAGGDPVVVRNDTGMLRLTVTVSEEVPQGVALAYKGRWLEAGAGHANVNVLNPGIKSDMGESSAVHSVEVTVEAARTAALAS
jgi:anaerobic selenocysteine-containing dehydrogenase